MPTEEYNVPDHLPDPESLLEGYSDPAFHPEEDDEVYEPSFFARLTANRLLIIVLVVAFLLLILGPWLYYLLNPPEPRPPRQIPRRAIPVLNERGNRPQPVLSGRNDMPTAT